MHDLGGTYMFGHNDNSQKKDGRNGASNDGIAAAADAIANDRNLQGGDAPGPSLSTYMPASSAPAAATPDPDSTQPDPASPTQPAAAGSPDTNSLLDIKHEALQALTPLVGQLNQTPEEKFRTTMMMIQASDNHELLKVAYEAAQQIGNEKERAQALLDIVNEINYFTQQQ